MFPVRKLSARLRVIYRKHSTTAHSATATSTPELIKSSPRTEKDHDKYKFNDDETIAIIKKYSSKKQTHKLLELWQNLIVNKVDITQKYINEFMDAFSLCGRWKLSLGLYFRKSYYLNQVTDDTCAGVILKILAKHKKYYKMDTILERVNDVGNLDVYAYTTLIVGYNYQKKYKHALYLYQIVKDNQLPINNYLLSNVLNACVHLQEYQQVINIFNSASLQGNPGLPIYHILLKVYYLLDDIDNAKKIYEKIKLCIINEMKNINKGNIPNKFKSISIGLSSTLIYCKIMNNWTMALEMMNMIYTDTFINQLLSHCPSTTIATATNTNTTTANTSIPPNIPPKVSSSSTSSSSSKYHLSIYNISQLFQIGFICCGKFNESTYAFELYTKMKNYSIPTTCSNYYTLLIMLQRKYKQCKNQELQQLQYFNQSQYDKYRDISSLSEALSIQSQSSMSSSALQHQVIVNEYKESIKIQQQIFQLYDSGIQAKVLLEHNKSMYQIHLSHRNENVKVWSSSSKNTENVEKIENVENVVNSDSIIKYRNYFTNAFIQVINSPFQVHHQSSPPITNGNASQTPTSPSNTSLQGTDTPIKGTVYLTLDIRDYIPEFAEVLVDCLFRDILIVTQTNKMKMELNNENNDDIIYNNSKGKKKKNKKGNHSNLLEEEDIKPKKQFIQGKKWHPRAPLYSNITFDTTPTPPPTTTTISSDTVDSTTSSSNNDNISNNSNTEIASENQLNDLDKLHHTSTTMKKNNVQYSHHIDYIRIICNVHNAQTEALYDAAYLDDINDQSNIEGSSSSSNSSSNSSRSSMYDMDTHDELTKSSQDDHFLFLDTYSNTTSNNNNSNNNSERQFNYPKIRQDVLSDEEVTSLNFEDLSAIPTIKKPMTLHQHVLQYIKKEYMNIQYVNSIIDNHMCILIPYDNIVRSFMITLSTLPSTTTNTTTADIKNTTSTNATTAAGMASSSSSSSSMTNYSPSILLSPSLSFSNRHIRLATIEDLADINTIYNYYVRNHVATFDTVEKTLEDRYQWFKNRLSKHVIIVYIENNVMYGWASLNPYSDRAAYDYTVENSIYINPVYHKNGYGNALMSELINYAKLYGIHTILARITDGNQPSIKLHEKYGFITVGVMKECGYKFNRWIDVTVMQKIMK